MNTVSSNSTMSSEGGSLQHDFEVLRNEYQVCKRKLDSKCEALLILSKDLDQCRQERDQFQLMAVQVQERYQGLKRQLAGVGPKAPVEGLEYSGMKSQNLSHLLYEMTESNKVLQFEVDDLKQKLQDAQGDIKLLREQIARQRVGTTDEGMNPRHFPAHEREELVQKLEAANEQYLQLEKDLQQVLDEKEDFVTERDGYKTKYEKLNTELNYILKGDEKRIVDIDALVNENKYLKDRMQQMEEEKSIAMATVSKYKSLLERKKNKGILKLGQNRSSGVVITQRQVQQLLENKSSFTPSVQTMADLQSLATALLETVNDKNLALSHQRKTNKILGSRVAELEKKVKTLEVSGLWNVPGNNMPNRTESLEKLRQEVEDIKTLIPNQSEENGTKHSKDLPDDVSSNTSEKEFIEEYNSNEITPNSSPESTPKHRANDVNTTQSKHQNSGLSLEDLDLLPTKDVDCSQGQDNTPGEETDPGDATPPSSPRDLVSKATCDSQLSKKVSEQFSQVLQGLCQVEAEESDRALEEYDVISMESTTLCTPSETPTSEDCSPQNQTKTPSNTPDDSISEGSLTETIEASQSPDQHFLASSPLPEICPLDISEALQISPSREYHDDELSDEDEESSLVKEEETANGDVHSTPASLDV